MRRGEAEIARFCRKCRSSARMAYAIKATQPTARPSAESRPSSSTEAARKRKLEIGTPRGKRRNRLSGATKYRRRRVSVCCGDGEHRPANRRLAAIAPKAVALHHHHRGALIVRGEPKPSWRTAAAWSRQMSKCDMKSRRHRIAGMMALPAHHLMHVGRRHARRECMPNFKLATSRHLATHAAARGIRGRPLT